MKFQTYKLATNASMCIAISASTAAFGQGIQTTGGLEIRIVPPERPVVSLATGMGHSAAVMVDGTLAGWGKNASGQSTPPKLESNAIAVSCGRTHSAALLEDGRIIAWGSDIFGQSGELPGPCMAVAAGADHTLGLMTDGSVLTMGDDFFGQCTAPDGQFVAIEAGAYTSFALTAEGEIVTWGLDAFGLGSPPAGPFISIAAGDFHALALRADGTVVGWGLDTEGSTLAPATSYAAIDAAGSTSAGILNGGDILIWGRIDAPELYQVPQGPFESIAISPTHALALRVDGSMVGWGADTYGEATTYIGGYESIRCMNSAVAAIRTADRRLVGWGIPETTGGGMEDIIQYPAESCETDGRFCKIAAFDLGRDRGGLLDENGTIWHWQISTTEDIQGSFELPDGSVPSDITLKNPLDYNGDDQVFFLVPDLGVYQFNQEASTAELLLTGSFASIKGGTEHLMTLALDGSVLCTGNDYHGQSTPPEGMEPASAISAGDTFSIALHPNGTLTTWGGILGQISGDPFVGPEVTDQPIRNDIVMVSSGNRHGIALTVTGEVIGWGNDDARQFDFPEGTRASGIDATGGTSAVILDFDCDQDGIVDAWAIRDRLVLDCNDNGIPDTCDEANGRPVLETCDCPGDFNDDGIVSGFDLSQMLSAWGLTDAEAQPWDLSGDNLIDGSDLTILLANWGQCPGG
jgi:alpha-tubulin suppressor-like RCC1 family protein